MAPNQAESVLADLGITLSKNRRGDLVWTLQISDNDPASRMRAAYFDCDLSKWKFEDDILESESPPEKRKCTVPVKTPKTVQNLTSTSRSLGNDWIQALPESAHTDFFRTYDWAATPLHGYDTWPHALRLYTYMLFSDNRAAAIYWGPQRIAIYNDNMKPLIGSLHPTLMGGSFEVVMPELWDYFGPIFHDIEAEQIGVARNKLEITLERHGFPEETWWDGGIVCLRDDHGDFGGAYFSWVEVTRTVLRDRETQLLNQLRQVSLSDTGLIWQQIHDIFAKFPRDISVAAIYSIDGTDADKDRLLLKHTIGISDACAVVPSTLHLTPSNGSSSLAPLFRRARESHTGFIIIDSIEDEIEPTSTGRINWTTYVRASGKFVVICLQVGKTVQGYILLGLNPQRQFDADHEQFVSDLDFQLREILIRIATEEQTLRKEQDLMEALLVSERRISRIVTMAPVGIYELAADGSMRWANNHFFDIMAVAEGGRDPSLFDWRDYILPEDQLRANTEMGKSLINKVEISDTLRLRRRWTPPGTTQTSPSEDEPFWVMYSASPDLQADGSVRSLMGCITDISHLKWTEQLQIRTTEAALKEKQRQEEFIDITSHEMRNPLSAIAQCADGILASFDEINADTDVQSLIEIIKQNSEAAESISFCAAHQKRIIDDVLALGKLDSGLLKITPTAFHPTFLVHKALQMFKGEFEANEIEIRTSLYEDQSPASDFVVYGDPARLMQIIVNLLTNAIKFTRTKQSRNITLSFKSTSLPPTTDLFGPDFRWSCTGKAWPDLTQESGFGQGDTVYLCYIITDTGEGIPKESAYKVFSKFEQADRRTYVKYGGSGLGLFISRELTEMQGGCIGVQSRAGVGSTFAFYTKARRTKDPPSIHFDTRNQRKGSADAAHGLEAVRSRNDFIRSKQDRGGPSRGTKYTILLVEDNILNQKVLAHQLAKGGCVVYVANHGGEAIDFVLQTMNRPTEYGSSPTANLPRHVDCILMDWEMPVCNGLKATKRIREIERQQGSSANVIIGITANARPEQISNLTEAGMDHVVSKPFHVPELLTNITDLVRAKGVE